MFEEDKIEPMKSGKASGWGIWNYTWVSLPVTEGNKHRNVVPDAIAWCEQCFGKMGYRWFEKQRKFYFQNEKDMTLFMIRWSS